MARRKRHNHYDIHVIELDLTVEEVLAELEPGWFGPQADSVAVGWPV